MIPSLDIGCEISNENDTSEFFRIFEMKIRRAAIKFDKQNLNCQNFQISVIKDFNDIKSF